MVLHTKKPYFWSTLLTLVNSFLSVESYEHGNVEFSAVYWTSAKAKEDGCEPLIFMYKKDVYTLEQCTIAVDNAKDMTPEQLTNAAEAHLKTLI
jgi:hypothetical protein